MVGSLSDWLEQRPLLLLNKHLLLASQTFSVQNLTLCQCLSQHEPCDEGQGCGVDSVRTMALQYWAAL